jgi:hypothetical protein
MITFKKLAEFGKLILWFNCVNNNKRHGYYVEDGV